MNNLTCSVMEMEAHHGDTIVHAAILIEKALKLGMAKISPDHSITVCGDLLQSPTAESADVNATENVNSIQFDGKCWSFQFDGLTVDDKDRLGWHYIQRLIQRPQQDVHVTELVSFVNGEPVSVMKMDEIGYGDVAVETIEDDEGNETQRVVTTEFRDEILSDENRAWVLSLLEKEREHLVVLQAKGLAREVLIKKEEIKEIQAYLTKARFGKINACFTNRAEVDRKSVAKAMKEAIKKIAGKHPALAEHLKGAIETGEYCSYRPQMDVCWEVATT